MEIQSILDTIEHDYSESLPATNSIEIELNTVRLNEATHWKSDIMDRDETSLAIIISKTMMDNSLVRERRASTIPTDMIRMAKYNAKIALNTMLLTKLNELNSQSGKQQIITTKGR